MYMFVTESNPMLLLKRTFNLGLQVVLMIHPTHKMGCCELWYFVVLGDIETVMEIQDLLLIHSWDSSSWQVFIYTFLIFLFIPFGKTFKTNSNYMLSSNCKYLVIKVLHRIFNLRRIQSQGRRLGWSFLQN